MTRNLKVLGLALVAALALTAFGASAAYAVPFTAPEGAVDLTGNQTTQNIFTTGGGEVKCNVAEFTGTNTAAESTEQLISPHYSGCTAFGFSAHVNATPCHYLFTAPVDIGGGKFTGEPPHVICTGGGAITITPTLFGFSVCTATIGEQTPTGGHVIFEPKGAGATRDLLVTSTVTGIHYTSTGGACGTGGGATNTDGVYTGAVTLKGYKHNSAHTEANHTAVTIP